MRRRRDDPFTALGLDRRPGLTDDEVRAAWRRVAAATHPDRADGGDPARFADAAAAYTALRTGAGRNEALADLSEQARRPRRRRSRRTRAGEAPPSLALPAGARAYLVRVRQGRPARLALRLLAATAAGAGAVLVAGWQPATPALITGAVTWLALTARRDLAPPP